MTDEDKIWNEAIVAAADKAYHSLTPFGKPLSWNRTDKLRAQMAADAGNAVMTLLRRSEK